MKWNLFDSESKPVSPRLDKPLPPGYNKPKSETGNGSPAQRNRSADAPKMWRLRFSFSSGKGGSTDE